MDLTLTDEEREIRDWVRTFVTKELMPLEPQVLERERNGERGFTLDEVKALQDKARQSGFFGIQTPEEYGGMGLGAVMNALIEVELGPHLRAVQVRRRRRQHPVRRQRRAEGAPTSGRRSRARGTAASRSPSPAPARTPATSAPPPYATATSG